MLIPILNGLLVKNLILYTPNESQTIIPFVSPMNSQFLFQTYGFVDSYPLII